MPEKSRRQMLQEMLAVDPRDAFLRFGLAMEFAKEGRRAEAIEGLRRLAADEPAYVAAYFQAAQLLVEQGSNAEAAELLRRGIAAAREQSNAHAADEMSAFLAEIESQTPLDRS